MNKLPYFEKGTHGGMDFERHERNLTAAYLYGYFLIIAIFFCVLASRLFQLTIVKGAYYGSLADQNRTREILIETERGTILDRKGFVIANNISGDVESGAPRIDSKRYYHDGLAFAHIIGYRQSADEADVKNDDCLVKLKPGDKVGKKGVEKLYECALRGKYGQKLIEVNAQGEYKKTLTVIPPTKGQTVQLAVDGMLQKTAYEQIRGKRAVVVALKPDTGEVLTMASSPSYDPQVFEDNMSHEIQSYFTDSSKPLFNRGTEGTYPPGSTFKIVVATGALEDKKIDDKTIVEDKGSIKAGSTSFGNWYYLEHGKVEGDVDIIKAIQRSNDIFFYNVGAKLGAVNVKSWAEKFGYGSKTGLGLDESAGTIPSPFWKEDALKEQWYLGDTYNMSIGQGYLLATPIQVAQMTQVIAHNGTLCKPKLLKVGANPFAERDNETNCKKAGISTTTLDLVKKGMIAACAPGGTGWPLFNFTIKQKGQTQVISTACKTGTAESFAGDSSPHAWFTVFAPAVNPEIVVTALVEESGQGSDIAGPIAKEVLKAYFERSQ